MTTLAGVVSEINQKKKTGVLSVMAKLSKQLLKIYFVVGEIHFIQFAERKDRECLDGIGNIEFSECFFLDGVKPAVPGKISLPTSAIIERLKTIDKPVTCKAGALPSAGDTQDFSVIRDRLAKALIRQIGPAGELVFSNLVIKWAASSPPTKQGLAELVNLLKQEIDDPKSRAEFVKEADGIIS